MGIHTRNKWGVVGIQSMKFDNSNNAASVSITFDNGDTLNLPPYSQGILPVLFSGETLSFNATSAGTVSVLLTFLNTREQAQVWALNTVLAGSVNVSGSSVLIAGAPVTVTNYSLALTLGGTSQVAINANGARKRLLIMNPATAAGQGIAGAESAFFNFGSAAGVNNGTSFELLPAAAWDSAGGPIPTDSVTVNAATTGHRFIIKEFN